MRGEFRTYWRKPGYWAFLARRHGSSLLPAGVIAGVLLMAAGGFYVAAALTEPETFTVERLVTVEKVIDGETVTSIVRQTRTLSEPAQTQTNLVTVVRDGETITVPGKSVLRTDTVTGPTITDTETQTNTRTQTQTERETTTNTETQTQTETQISDRVTTETEIRNVPGPERTITETETETETETGPTTTVTDTETETETETVTETETAP